MGVFLTLLFPVLPYLNLINSSVKKNRIEIVKENMVKNHNKKIGNNPNKICNDKAKKNLASLKFFVRDSISIDIGIPYSRTPTRIDELIIRISSKVTFKSFVSCDKKVSIGKNVDIIIMDINDVINAAMNFLLIIYIPPSIENCNSFGNYNK
jgi:hypothetical protein